jgi:RNA polymerase sigma-32 factor
MTANSLQTLNLNLPIGSIDAYIYRVNQIPLLSQSEELDLAERLLKHNDIHAARALVMAHLRYVVRIAKGYLGYGLPLNDLIQEGNVGLMKAVKRFNPKMGARLVTFAAHWIKAEMHEFILRNWRIVKVATTKAQRKLFFNLRSMKKEMHWLNQEEVADIAKDLKVKPETVREMEMRLSMRDAAFDAYEDDNDEEAAFAPAAYLEDHRYNPATEHENHHTRDTSHHALREALSQLDPRSQEIIRARWLDDENKVTLQDLAEKYQVSAERIRQLEKIALEKLKVGIIS